MSKFKKLESRIDAVEHGIEALLAGHVVTSKSSDPPSSEGTSGGRSGSSSSVESLAEAVAAIDAAR